MKYIYVIICLLIFVNLGCSDYIFTNPADPLVRIDPPSSPFNPSPKDTSIITASDVTLSWACSSIDNNGLRYDVYLDQQNPPKTKTAEVNGKTAYNALGLASGSTYYWRIYANDTHGNVTAGPVWSFTTLGIPQPPQLQSPVDKADNVSTAPLLSWSSVKGALSYSLQAASDSTFLRLVYDQSGLTSAAMQLSHLNYQTVYYWRVSVTNAAGTSDWSLVRSFRTGGYNCGTETITYSGKTYHTVQIGSQCWLKENLDAGTVIKVSQDQTNNGVIEKYCYNDDPKNCDKYGALYQWNEAVQYTSGGIKVQGICPAGWHIPSDEEFKSLASSVNNNGNELKASGQGSGYGAGTNTSGFSALLGGTRNNSGYCESLNYSTVFWSSGEFNSFAYSLLLNDSSSDILLGYYSKSGGISVRCVKD